MMQRRRYLVATTNDGKMREICALLDGLAIELVSLDAYADVPPPDETGATFAENARLKALYYATATRLPAIADDSGLEIDAMNGGPGVESARFGGSDTTYPEKFRLLYDTLGRARRPESPARFVCAVALAEGDAITFEAHGTVEGRIALRPAGTGGFGYDPIFFYPPYGCTLAEVSPEQKAAVSHRGAAFRELRGYLQDRLRPPGSGPQGRSSRKRVRGVPR
jgi:non-canonical purine NTP pyrophosphatase (RdgB/HAM1 family)